MKRYQAVVVGAGPAGLAATIEMARRGVEVLLIERRSTSSPLPRATVLSLRSMELLRSWGLQESVETVADAVEMSMLAMPTAARVGEGTTIDVGYPSRAQSEVLSPAHPVCVAQDLLEGVLLRHVHSLAHVEVLQGVEVLGVASHDDETRIAVRFASGQVRHIDAEYVVGADGARSTVRSALGIRLDGWEVLLEGARVEFRAPLWDVVGAHRHLIYATTSPDSTGVLLPAGLGDRWLFAVTHGPDGDVRHPLTHSELFARMLRATDLDRHAATATRFDRFTAGAQIATQFSHGRVFLAGDAAHRVTPRGGTGLNIALADGHDIGWKLSWVLRGWAPTTLLDTYESERRPAVQHNVNRSADPIGSRRPTAHEIQVDVGGRVKHAWVAPEVSTLDLLSDGLTLLGPEPTGACTAEPQDYSGPPIRSVGLDPLTVRTLGLGSRGAALLRPDGLAAATWSAPPPRVLVRLAATTALAQDRPLLPAAVGRQLTPDAPVADQRLAAI